MVVEAPIIEEDVVFLMPSQRKTSQEHKPGKAHFEVSLEELRHLVGRLGRQGLDKVQEARLVGRDLDLVRCCHG